MSDLALLRAEQPAPAAALTAADLAARIPVPGGCRIATTASP
jgi:hypothetical protein